MHKEQSISFIGSGNLAWHLAPALDNAGFIVREVYSRNPHHAEQLISRLYQAEVKATLDFSTSDSSIFIIAVSDSAIEPIAREIILPDEALLIHTSGSRSLNDLQYAATPLIGVLYLLQTFSKEKTVDFKSVPIFIESINKEAEEVLQLIAHSISNQVYKISSEERKALHVAAVFASNFTNHILTMSKKIMHGHSLDYKWLEPLIVETIQKSLAVGPEVAQTGPARRSDFETLDQHLEFLKEDEHITEIYKLISQHIVNYYEHYD